MNNNQLPDTESIKQYFDSIIGFCKIHYPKIAYSLRAPATSSMLDDLERLIGVRLPMQFRQLYQLANGQAEDCALFPDGFELMPLENIRKTWLMLKNMYDSHYEMRVEGEDDGPVRSIWWHPRWIPFAFQVSGDHYCLDMHPGYEGQEGQIIEFIHNDEPRPLLGDNLADFLRRYDEGIQSGKFLMHPEWGTFVANM
ncbi:MAG: SMI1/KNR4 family protein [Gammaproteobacteria bacterium]|nr:SMI1/KNR4 family protein [Gammaproteobacteria bacterium]MDH5803209.1 SMI1/KNR4 family protein [Gammaproteobacteria bacterium]